MDEDFVFIYDAGEIEDDNAATNWNTRMSPYESEAKDKLGTTSIECATPKLCSDDISNYRDKQEGCEDVDKNKIDLDLLKMFGQTTLNLDHGLENDKDVKKAIEDIFNSSEKGPDVKPPRNVRRTLKLFKDAELGYGFWLQTYGFGKNVSGSDSNLRTFVRFVEEEGPGYIAGLREGDVIVEVDGQNVEGEEKHGNIVEMIKQHEKELVLVVRFVDAVQRVKLAIRLKKKEAKLKSKTKELEQLIKKEHDVIINGSPFTGSSTIPRSHSKKLPWLSESSHSFDTTDDPSEAVKHVDYLNTIEKSPSALSLPESVLRTPENASSISSLDSTPDISADNLTVQTSQFNKRTSMVIDTTSTLKYIEQQIAGGKLDGKKESKRKPTSRNRVTDLNLLRKFSIRSKNSTTSSTIWYIEHSPQPSPTMSPRQPSNRGDDEVFDTSADGKKCEERAVDLNNVEIASSSDWNANDDVDNFDCNKIAYRTPSLRSQHSCEGLLNRRAPNKISFHEHTVDMFTNPLARSYSPAASLVANTIAELAASDNKATPDHRTAGVTRDLTENTVSVANSTSAMTWRIPISHAEVVEPSDGNNNHRRSSSPLLKKLPKGCNPRLNTGIQAILPIPKKRHVAKSCSNLNKSEADVNPQPGTTCTHEEHAKNIKLSTSYESVITRKSETTTTTTIHSNSNDNDEECDEELSGSGSLSRNRQTSYKKAMSVFAQHDHSG